MSLAFVSTPSLVLKSLADDRWISGQPSMMTKVHFMDGVCGLWRLIDLLDCLWFGFVVLIDFLQRA